MLDIHGWLSNWANDSRGGETDRLLPDLFYFDTVCNDAKSQGLNRRFSLALRHPISHYAWKIGDLGDPTAIFFALEFDLEIHLGLSDADTIVRQPELISN